MAKVLKTRWEPATGPGLHVVLYRLGDSDLAYEVHTSSVSLSANGRAWVPSSPTKRVGSVFYQATYGWRWRRDGVNEQRGSRLTTRDCAVSALLFALRQEGKV